MTWAIDIALLVGILVAAVLVVSLDNLNGSVMALSGLGVLLTVLFVVLAAPDVAHSEAVVGAVVLPLLYLMAVGKVRTSVGQTRDLGESGEHEDEGEVEGGPEPAGDGNHA